MRAEIVIRDDAGEIVTVTPFPEVPGEAVMAVDAVPTDSHSRHVVAVQFAPGFADTNPPTALLLSAWCLGEYCRENGVKLREAFKSLALIAHKVARAGAP